MDKNIDSTPIQSADSSGGKNVTPAALSLSPIRATPRKLTGPLTAESDQVYEDEKDDLSEFPSEISVGLSPVLRPGRREGRNGVMEVSDSPISEGSSFLTPEEKELLRGHKKWKSGFPIWSTPEEAKVFLPRRRNRRLPKLSSENGPAIRDHFTVSVEKKIASARQDGLLRRVHSFNDVTPKRLPTMRPHQAQLRSSSPDYVTRCYELSEMRKTLNATAQNKRELVMEKKKRLAEQEKKEKALKYTLRHENRRRASSMVRCFESSGRKRQFLTQIFVFLYGYRVLMKPGSEKTTVGKLLQDKAKAHERYEMIRRIARRKLKRINSSKEEQEKYKLNYYILIWVARFRMKRRSRSAELLLDFLKRAKHSSSHFKRVVVNFQHKVRLLQRNIRAQQACRRARLEVLRMKMEQIELRLKAEAERYERKHNKKKAFGNWMDDNEISSLASTPTSLKHPKYKIDLNVHIREELKEDLLKTFLEWKQKDWIRNVEQSRSRTYNVGCNTVRTMLQSDSKARDLAQQIGGDRKDKFPVFVLYSTLTVKDFVNLLVSAHEASTALIVRRKKLFADVDNTKNLMHKIDHMLYHNREEAKKPTPGYAKSKHIKKVTNNNRPPVFAK